MPAGHTSMRDSVKLYSTALTCTCGTDGGRLRPGLRRAALRSVSSRASARRATGDGGGAAGAGGGGTLSSGAGVSAAGAGGCVTRWGAAAAAAFRALCMAVLLSRAAASLRRVAVLGRAVAQRDAALANVPPARSAHSRQSAVAAP